MSEDIGNNSGFERVNTVVDELDGELRFRLRRVVDDETEEDVTEDIAALIRGDFPDEEDEAGAGGVLLRAVDALAGVLPRYDQVIPAQESGEAYEALNNGGHPPMTSGATRYPYWHRRRGEAGRNTTFLVLPYGESGEALSMHVEKVDTGEYRGTTQLFIGRWKPKVRGVGHDAVVPVEHTSLVSFSSTPGSTTMIHTNADYRNEQNLPPHEQHTIILETLSFATTCMKMAINEVASGRVPHAGEIT